MCYYSYFQRIACPPSQMVTETASIIDGGRHKQTSRFKTAIRTIIELGFSLNSLLLGFLAMVVGYNESTTTKNVGESLAISIAMQMRRYDAGHIARWSTSRASLKATGCRHRASACTVSPRRPPWSTNLLKQHNKLIKHNF